MSLRRRITLTICSIIILLMVLLSSIIYSKSSSILNDEVEKYMLSQLDRARENIDLLVEINGLETKTLALNTRVAEYMKREINTRTMNMYLIDEMKVKNDNGDYYKDLFILNTEGMIIASCMPEAMGLDLSTRDYFSESKKNIETVTSDILVARSDHSLIVITISPILDIEDKVLGYAGIAMKAEFFSDIVTNLELGQTGYYAIIDSKNRVLVHKNKSLIGRASPFNSTKDILRRELMSASIIRKVVGDSKQNKEVHIYKPMDSKRWVLVAILPEKEVYERSSSLLFYVLLIGSFGIILAIYIGVYVSERISQPIVAMTDYVNKAIADSTVIEESIANSIQELSLEDESSEDLIKASKDDEIGNLRKALHSLKDYFDWLTNRFEYENSKILYPQNLKRTLDNDPYRTANFISTLSHDLKTSITLIKGYAKGLEAGVIADEDIRKRFLTGIYSSATDIEKITCDILDNAYEANYCLKLHYERVNAENFVSSLFNDTKQLIVNSEREFHGFWECKSDMALKLDPIKIKRAWNNLINNAIKYSNQGTVIDICITVKDGLLKFKVIDKGRGIADSEIDSIFEMFYKGMNSKEKGYGLGLFISKSIIEAHGSTLNVASQVGEGTCFWFEIDTIEDKEDWIE